MREFLSLNSVEFEDRNIATNSHWREDLVRLMGEVVVPVLVVGSHTTIGLDEERIAAALGLNEYRSTSAREGLAAPPELEQLTIVGLGVQADLAHFVARIQREMEFNAMKEDSGYRDGQHDGMRFARDGILRILTGTYEREDLVVERQPSESDSESPARD